MTQKVDVVRNGSDWHVLVNHRLHSTYKTQSQAIACANKLRCALPQRVPRGSVR